MKPVNRFFRFLSLFCLTAGFVGVLAALPTLHLSSSSQRGISLLFDHVFPKAAIAQRFNVDEVWRLVYQAQPNLPLENQYIRRSSGEAAVDNTLVGRLIRYHVYVKGRPPVYRLDWKITLADYLGVNEQISPTLYPSADTLQVNPLEGDITAIRSLNRTQRDALIQALVDAFAPFLPSSPANPELSPQPSTPTAPSSPQREPLREPQPGDADLLQL
jgi:hypothetical protein